MTSAGERLRQARKRAGFATATDAVRRFGWSYPTYSGHENGNRGIKRHDLMKYAEAFAVDVTWLEHGEKHAPGYQAPLELPASAGFSESMPVYHPPTDRLRLDLERLALSLAPGARRTTFLVVSRPYPSFSLIAGDVVLVDQNNVSPEAGTLVVCQTADTASGGGSTVLKMQTPGGPVSGYGDIPLGKTEVEAVLGTVISSVRGAPGAGLTV